MNEELTLGDVLTPTAPQPEPTLNDYYLRCRESDRPKLYAMAVALGVLAEANGIYTLASGWEGAWSEVGTIYRDGDPVCTPDGEVYWHANLRLKIVSLTDYAI